MNRKHNWLVSSLSSRAGCKPFSSRKGSIFRAGAKSDSDADDDLWRVHEDLMRQVSFNATCPLSSMPKFSIDKPLGRSYEPNPPPCITIGTALWA